jgi:hypothetical protein
MAATAGVSPKLRIEDCQSESIMSSPAIFRGHQHQVTPVSAAEWWISKAAA